MVIARNGVCILGDWSKYHSKNPSSNAVVTGTVYLQIKCMRIVYSQPSDNTLLLQHGFRSTAYQVPSTQPMNDSSTRYCKSLFTTLKLPTIHVYL